MMLLPLCNSEYLFKDSGVLDLVVSERQSTFMCVLWDVQQSDH